MKKGKAEKTSKKKKDKEKIEGKKKKNPYIPEEMEPIYTAEGFSKDKDEGEMDDEGGQKTYWKKKQGWREKDSEMDKEEENQLVIVSKEEWGGLPARWTRTMGPPYEVFHVTDTGTEKCYDRETCIRTLQKIQDFQMSEMNLPDIAWNFMFASDGTIYEGRGWENEGYKPVAVKKEFGKQTIVELGFIGDFTYEDVCNPIQVSKHLFIKRAMKQGKVPVKHIVTTIKKQREVW